MSAAIKQAGRPTPVAADIPLPCPACSYDLRGNTSGRCPECGLELDEEALSTRAAIPWQARRRIGRYPALIRTLSLALRHPVQLARQAGREVDYTSARKFQHGCCILAWAVLVLLCGPVWKEMHGSWPDSFLVVLADGSIVLAAAAGLYLWLLLSSGLPSYFFHPRELAVEFQDRAIALSYYSAAPLAVVPAAAALTFLVVMVFNSWAGEMPLIVQAAGLTLMCSAWLLVVVELLALPLVMLAKGLHASGTRIFLCWLVMAIGWPLFFVVFVVGLPALVFYAQLVYHTLR